MSGTLSEPRVDRLALERKNTEAAFVCATKWLLAHEAFERLDSEHELGGDRSAAIAHMRDEGFLTRDFAGHFREKAIGRVVVRDGQRRRPQREPCLQATARYSKPGASGSDQRVR
jgi:hypothetical protein